MASTPGYQQTLDYLFERLPMFSRIGKAALKPDLTNTLKLCAALGNPQDTFKSVHLAGTNGKGSTSHALAAILQNAGYKTGLYTSPHLIDFRERIRINGTPVSQQWVVGFVAKTKGLIEEINPSFFEITVAMAFLAFAEAQVDIAIIETGLGGRLDSTNIITPLLSIITNISYDHKDLLGETLPEIAAEKAGIMKHGVPVIIGEQNDATERVFFEHSVHHQSPLFYAESHWDMVRVKQEGRYQYYKAVDKVRQAMYSICTDLTGNYQAHNIKTILTATEQLSFMGFTLTMENTIAALANVKGLTGLMGRWDWLQEQPIIICDVAHNPAGLTEVMHQWQQLTATRKHIVLGFVKDKDVTEALALFPKDATYYFCNAQILRALPAAELQERATAMGLNGEAYPTVTEAFAKAKSAMGPGDALLITGSFFIVGEVLEALQPEGE
jgi:dihydrofolate synthase/folylpolyglutamate synthase